ncbi:hypothetical protein NQ314_011325 [Rhamnusium bicolor]|uniref:Uncharacterized protein n=1 Tax=Rhamnusium bicolor TaxID=1586634 RepID=A0AAV8XJU0_9CUCU|nr:hypothetical protein NQ314_011325 [Rhamnusium bicolor]
MLAKITSAWVRREVNPNNFEAILGHINKVNYVNPNIKEGKGDLFSWPEYFSLAHCVSQDFHMGQSIVTLFKKCFGELLMQNKNLGEVAELILPERDIYCMITKTW